LAYLLLETGGRLTLEDGSGFLLLEAAGAALHPEVRFVVPATTVSYVVAGGVLRYRCRPATLTYVVPQDRGAP